MSCYYSPVVTDLFKEYEKYPERPEEALENPRIKELVTEIINSPNPDLASFVTHKPLIRQYPDRDTDYYTIQTQRLPLLKRLMQEAQARLSKEDYLRFITREDRYYRSPLWAACWMSATAYAEYLLECPEIPPLSCVSEAAVSAFGIVLHNAMRPDQYTNPKFKRALILKFLDHADYRPVIECIKSSMDITELATAESMEGGFRGYLHSKVGRYLPTEEGQEEPIFEFNPEGLAWLRTHVAAQTAAVRSRWSDLRSAWMASVLRSPKRPSPPSSSVAP
jgi:hypothetical protein